MKAAYFETMATIEQLHKLYLEVMKMELDRLDKKDINNVQASVLYNIGQSQITVGELTEKGYYLGTNVSYNLRKMVQNDYVIQEMSPYDKRAFHVKLSPKGLNLFKNLNKAIENQEKIFHKEVMDQYGTEDFSRTLRKIEIFLSRLLSS